MAFWHVVKVFLSEISIICYGISIIHTAIDSFVNVLIFVCTLYFGYLQ